MKLSTKNKLTGSLHLARGAVKEKAGQITNNSALSAEGQVEKLTGKLQHKVGKVGAFLKR